MIYFRHINKKFKGDEIMIKDGKLDGANFYCTYRTAAMELKDAVLELCDNDKTKAGAVQGAFYQMTVDYLLDGKEWTAEEIKDEYGIDLNIYYMMKFAFNGFKRNMDTTRAKVIGGSMRGNPKKKKAVPETSICPAYEGPCDVDEDLAGQLQWA